MLADTSSGPPTPGGPERVVARFPGLDADVRNGLWRQEPVLTVFAMSASGTGRFGFRAPQAVLNVRVRDPDAVFAQLRARGADVTGDTQDMKGPGRSGWVTGPEGNRAGLRQPGRLVTSSPRR